MASRARFVVAVAAALLAAPAARAAGVGEACKSDGECAVGSICGEADVCVALPRKKSVIPFYFHQPGESGYRHITPLLYFSTWDKHREVKVQVPLIARRIDKDNHK